MNINLPTYVNGKTGPAYPVRVIADYTVPQSGNPPVAVPLTDMSGIEWLAASIRANTGRGFDIPIAITGKRRISKSTFGLHLARQLEPNFPLEHCTFQLDEYHELIKSTPEGSTPIYVYDESIEGMFRQEWQRQTAIVKTLNISGALLITHVFIMPSLGDLNSKIKPMLTFWIYIEDRGLAIVEISDVDKHNGSVWWHPILAIKYGPLTGEYWDQYQRKKDLFIRNYNPEKRTVRGEKATESRNAGIRWIASKGLYTQEEIGAGFNLSQKRISEILQL